jgi:hypothetical protein
MHLLSRCSAFLKSKLANVAVCPVRTAVGPVRYSAWQYGAPGATQEGRGCTSGGALKQTKIGKRRRDKKKRKEGNTTAFFISRTALRGFFGILTTPWRKKEYLRGGFETRGSGVNRA